MTTIEMPTYADERARWRSRVGLDLPTPPAEARRARYEGGAQVSWQRPVVDKRTED